MFLNQGLAKLLGCSTKSQGSEPEYRNELKSELLYVSRIYVHISLCVNFAIDSSFYARGRCHTSCRAGHKVKYRYLILSANIFKANYACKLQECRLVACTQ